MSVYSWSQLRRAALAPLLGMIACASAMAQAQGRRDSAGEEHQVVILRGAEAGKSQGRQNVAATGRAGGTLVRQEAGVTVMRPAPDSFLRGTERLAAEAAARDDSEARAAALERDRQVTRTLKAVEDAARAAEQEAITRRDRYYPVYVPVRPEATPAARK